jgi:transposase-like protein
MGVPRKQYSREFKEEAVRLVTQQGLSIAQASRDLGINDNLLSRWKKELESHGAQAFPGQGQPHDEELTRLRREVEVLRREREI